MKSIEKAPDYGAAYAVLGLLAVAGWILVGLGAFAAFVGFSDGRLQQALIGGIVLVFGVLTVAAAQISRAVMDNSTYSWHILHAVNRLGQAEFSGDGSAVNGSLGSNGPSLASDNDLVWTERKIWARGGREVTIRRDDSGRLYAETIAGLKYFKSFAEAREYFE